MKSKEEIEKYLGFKIVSSNEEQVRDSSFAMSPDLDRYVSKYQQYYTVTVKVLSKESEKALTDLLKESMTKGDLETASTCHSILMKESSYYKAHPNAIGLNFKQGAILSEYEKQQKAIEEEQARIKAEQEAKAREEEQARIKAEQEAKAREEEQARIKAEQEAKAREEEQARIKAEQEAKAREEEQARIKAEQEAKAREEEQARLKAEQEAKAREEEQARLKAEQEAKAREEEQARLKAEQEAKAREEEQARLKAEQEAKAREEEQARLKAEQEAKAREEEQARLKAEQEAKAREEEQARLKAEQEAKAREEEQARLKAEQEAKAREEEQARLKAEQEEKERQASIDKDIAEYQQYEELISRRPELDKLLEELKYEEFSVAVNGHISERFGELLNDLKKLPQNEREIILQQYNRFADIPINEQGDIIRDGVVQTASEPKVKDSEQESKGTEQDIIETIKNDSNVVEETTGTSIDSADIMEAQEKTREEIDRQLREHEEYMASVEPQIKARVDRTMEEYWQSWGSSEVTASKQYEEQQPGKIRPREKSLKDEVGDEFRTTEQQMQKQDNPSVDFWMNRFNGWYSAIDRVSQTVKNKFVKMKSDIIKTISEKLKERNNHRQFYTQEQDTNER